MGPARRVRAHIIDQRSNTVSKKLYVGNLSFDTRDDDLRSLFEQYGAVESAEVVSDRDSGRSRGFGFVVMPSDQEAQAAIDALNEKEVGGRNIAVNEARPPKPRTGGGGYRGGGGGGGGYRGGGGGGGSRGGRGGGGRGGRDRDNDRW